MKTIYLLIFTVLVFCSFITVNAQVALERYTAQTVLDYVTGHSKNGASDTYLVTVITSDAPIPTPLGNIKLSHNLSDGKSNVWVYIYYSPSTQNYFLYGVSRVNVLGNPTNTAFEIPQEALGFDPKEFTKKEITSPIMDSDKIEGLLKTNQTFNTFKQEHPDSQPNFVVLTKLEDVQVTEFPMLNGDDPYWTVQFVNSEDPNYPMTCFVNTKNDEVVCIRFKDITSVAEQVQTLKLAIVPNPSSNYMATVHFSKSFAQGTIRLINSLGEVVKDLTPIAVNNSNQFSFSTVGIPTGMYLLSVQNGTETITTTFVIQ